MEVGTTIEKYQMVNGLLMYAYQLQQGIQKGLAQDQHNIGMQSQLSMIEVDIDALKPVAKKYFREIMDEIEKENSMEALKHPALSQN